MDVCDILRKESPQFKKAQDVLAFAVHAHMLLAGFRCTDETGKGLPDTPPDWNKLEEVYTFHYTHPRFPEGERVVLKILQFDRTLIIHCGRTKDNKLNSSEISVDDFVDSTQPLNDYDKVLKNTEGLRRVFEHSVKTFVEPPKEKEEKRDREEEYPSLRDPSFRPRPQIPFPGQPYPFGGDFDTDKDPFFPGAPGGIGGGGSLFGPERFNVPPPGYNPMEPRYDPVGPFGPLGGEPNPDHLRMPRGFEPQPSPLGPFPRRGGRGGGRGRGRGRGGRGRGPNINDPFGLGGPGFGGGGGMFM